MKKKELNLGKSIKIKNINITNKYNIKSANTKEKSKNFIYKKKSKTELLPVINNLKQIRFKIEKGNNSVFICKLLSNRKEFINNNNSSFLLNILWSQVSKGFNFQKLEFNSFHKWIFNHFEFHSELTNKINLNSNIIKHCDRYNINYLSFIPVTYSFNLNSINFIDEIQKFARIFKFNELSNKNEFQLDNSILKSLGNFKLKTIYQKYDQKIEFKLDNFYNNIKYRKNKFMDKLKKKSKKDSKIEKKHIKILNKMKYFHYYFDLLNWPSIKNNFEEFVNKFDIIPKFVKNFNDGKNIWIFKLSDFNRGIGIEVFSSLKELNEIILKLIKEKNFLNLSKKTFIIQKYIEKPLLINNKKFDIRIFSLLDQNGNIYVYKEGYLRLSSIDYNIHDNGKYIHLTNDAVQKNHKDYGINTDKNKLSFEKFSEYMKNNYDSNFNFEKDILKKIIEIIKLSFQSVKYKINKNKRRNCFQLFGFDFLIDIDLNIWLIEINTNPCLSFSGDYLSKLIKRMLNDLFKLTIDKIFKTNLIENLTYPLQNYKDDENLFDFIINLND